MLQKRNHRSRKASAHQKQIQRFTIFLGGLAVLVVVAVIWFLSRPQFSVSPGH